MDFASDLVLMTNTLEEHSVGLKIMREKASELVLNICWSKTKTIFINPQLSQQLPLKVEVCQNRVVVVRVVSSSNFVPICKVMHQPRVKSTQESLRQLLSMGNLITFGGTYKAVLQRCVLQRRNLLQSLTKTSFSTSRLTPVLIPFWVPKKNGVHSCTVLLSRLTKMRIFHASVGSVLLYDTETWAETTKTFKMLDLTHSMQRIPKYKGTSLIWFYQYNQPLKIWIRHELPPPPDYS